MGRQVGPSVRGFDADNSTAEGAAAGNEPPNAEWPIKDRDGYLTVSRLLPAPACWQCRLRASIVRSNSV